MDYREMMDVPYHSKWLLGAATPLQNNPAFQSPGAPGWRPEGEAGRAQGLCEEPAGAWRVRRALPQPCH